MLTSLKQHLITENLAEHRAVEAWQRFGGDARRVDAVEVLKEKKPKKSRVYRLLGAGPGGLSVIAKRCRTATATVERAMYERVLSCLPAPHLRCYGSIPDPASGQEWIFLEDAGDTEVGEDELGDVVGWLGRFHTSAAAAARSAGAELPDRGLAYHLGHMDSAHRDLRAGLDMPEFAGEDRRLLVATLEFARGRRTLLAAVGSDVPLVAEDADSRRFPAEERARAGSRIGSRAVRDRLGMGRLGHAGLRSGQPRP